MTESNVAFAEIYLLDADSSQLAGGGKTIALSCLGCFAPSKISSDVYVPGYLFINHAAGDATFHDFAAIRRARWVGNVIGLLVLAGLLCFLAIIILYLAANDEPWMYSGPSAFENIKQALPVLGGGIVVVLALLIFGSSSKTSARSKAIAIPEDTRVMLDQTYQSHVAALETAKQIGAPPPSISARVGKDLAEKAAETAVETILTPSLAKFAVKVASEAAATDPAEAAREQVIEDAFAQLRDAAMLAHFRLTARKPISIAPKTFLAMRSVRRDAVNHMVPAG